MSQPLILIVDENDQPAGKSTIGEASQKGLTRRIVRLMIENSKGQILLQKRSEGERVYPGRWDNSVAGHVDWGESDEEALHRETQEEIGLSDLQVEKIGTYYNEVPSEETPNIKKYNHIYKTNHDVTPTNLSPDEVSEVKWFTTDEIKKMIKRSPEDFTDGVIEVISRFY